MTVTSASAPVRSAPFSNRRMRAGAVVNLAMMLVAKNAFPILLPKRIAPGNGRVSKSEMMRARFTGNREATFSGGTQQLDTACATQVLTMHMRTGEFSQDNVPGHDHVFAGGRPTT